MGTSVDVVRVDVLWNRELALQGRRYWPIDWLKILLVLASADEQSDVAAWRIGDVSEMA